MILLRDCFNLFIQVYIYKTPKKATKGDYDYRQIGDHVNLFKNKS